MNSITFQPIVGFGWILIIALLMFVIFALRPHFSSLSQQRRRWLIGFRIIIVLMLVATMLRPGCRQTIRQPQSATVLLFIDISRSMQLPHEPAGLTRWQKLNEIIEEHKDQIRDLSSKMDVRVYAIDGHAIPLDIKDGVPVLPEEPEGSQTDFGTSIDEAIRSHLSQRVAAAFLLSDGTQNADDPEVEISQAIAELDQLQIPLYSIPFGQPGDLTQTADVAVVGLPDQFSVFAKNRLTVQAQIRLAGFANQQVPVRLLVTDSSGKEEIVDTKMATSKEADQTLAVELNYEPDSPGQYLLTVEVEEQPSELVTQNNRLPAFLTVHEGGLKVLYIEGDPSPEQSFLRRSLAASQDIEVEFNYYDRRNRDRWPLDLYADLSDPSYDVFIIGNIDSRAFVQGTEGRENIRALMQAITEQGKGLLLLGGDHAFGPGRWHANQLSDLFPVRMQRFEAQDFDSPINFDLHIDRPLQMRPTENHFITNLVPGAANQDAWDSLPPLDGANRFVGGLKERSQVLAAGRQGEPLLIVGNYGGRVVAFAGNSTWRWWLSGHQELHKRFWRQTILWLAKLDGLSDQNIWIDLPQRRFSPGSTVYFSTGAQTPTGERIADATFEAQVISPDGTRTNVTLLRQDETVQGDISGELLSEPGTYKLEVQAKSGATALGDSTAEFIVFDEDREKSLTAADPYQLSNMSSQTKAWGGELVQPEDFGTKLESLKDVPLEMTKTIPLPIRLVGEQRLSRIISALFLIIFAVWLSIEWFMRKSWGMV